MARGSQCFGRRLKHLCLTALERNRAPMEQVLGAVPRICAFHGVVIWMFYNEHGPPHFHAEHAGRRAAVDFDGNILAGNLSLRALRLVREWATIHAAELARNWVLARAGRPLARIPPLE